ncbi:hypothetical protein ASPZODRAFT_13969 [Penicilliopsis zonata CBS 506.65]|uniref:C3H1-type domain-containing protein n=1 Tax=Penicilliopsis zonata CBS 506.65 TaxID=1073090 RepID=A0A1L9SPS7_9EURO|nr:hypothetical protein ASPZODRAFT_13969 [Penicilliopsis zonata CBS 506.65]OJJ49245.1 hypothetical protein ASPZODRAFT_13969 [Penicilliopsis zonata CBS 506.65]
MASPIRPQFFCSRPNGSLTPLVALDELPSYVSIRGVPRLLSAGDTQGMTSLGAVTSRAQFYVVDGVSVDANRGSNSPSDDNGFSQQRLGYQALVQQSTPLNVAAHSGPGGGWLTHGASNGAVSRQNPTKKEYCSYWIRHGECDYQQQGCLYKHEMPTDLGMLDKLGLRDIPRWYREKFGMSSLLPGGGHQHPRGNTNTQAPPQQWKDEVQDRGVYKQLSFPSRLGITGCAEFGQEAFSNINGAVGQQKVVTPSFTAAPQQPVTAPALLRSAFAPVGGHISREQTPSHHNGVKPFLNGHNSHRKIDLLAFDPITEYASLDRIGGHMGGHMTDLPSSPIEIKLTPEEADRAQREELVRNLQSLMPAPHLGGGSSDFLPTSFDHAGAQGRGKRYPTKSRRLYQPRSPTDTVVPGKLQSPIGEVPYKTKPANAAAFANTPSTKNSPPMASPIGGPVLGGHFSSDSPGRMVSPSDSHSTSSSADSAKLGTHFGHRAFAGRANKVQTMPSVIERRGVGSSNDLIGFGAGRGK